MEIHPNDCARESQPSVWIFRGKSIGWLVVAGGVAWLTYAIVSPWVDWWIALAIAVLPLGVVTAWTHYLVNSRPPSYCDDLINQSVWRSAAWLFRHGGLTCPPILWKSRDVPHPAEF